MFRKIAVFIFWFFFGAGYILNPFKPTIHIYIDWATTPALLQMMNLIQQPTDDKKFIFWRRFPNLKERMDLKKHNAIQIDLPQSEGANDHSLAILSDSIKNIYSKNPNANYVIHSNLRWNEILIPILQIIPRKRVKHIHTYEDALSNVVFSKRHYTLGVNPQKINYHFDLKQILDGKKAYHYTYDFAFHTLYPTTYYFGFVEYAQNNSEFDTFFRFLKTAHIKDISWNKISQTLTEEQKQLIYSLVGFDAGWYKKQINGKKVDFFLLRSAFSTQDEQIKTVLNLFKNNDKNRILVLKEHPNLSIRNIAQKIKEKIPNAIIFPKHIPFEILILADLMPDTVSGYPSSIFYSVPKEKIKYYITSDRDYYLPFLKELNIITNKQVTQSMKD